MPHNPAAFLAMAIIACGLSLSALAEGQNKADDAKDEKTADKARSIVDDYAPTGETRGCITLSRIAQSHILSETEIFFEMKGNRGYLNTLPHRCPSLDFYESYTYKTSTNQLCNTDFITVLMRSARPGASCGLGMFVEYERKK